MDVLNELLIKLIHRGYGHGFVSMIVGRHDASFLTMKFSFPRIYDAVWE